MRLYSTLLPNPAECLNEKLILCFRQLFYYLISYYDFIGYESTIITLKGIMMDKINATKILEEALSRSLGLPRYIEIMAGNPNKSGI